MGESQKIEVGNAPGRKGAEALGQERRFCGSMSESGDDQNSPDTVLVGRVRVGVEVPPVYVCVCTTGREGSGR